MAEKEKKLPKLAKPFTRAISETDFNKKILDRIFTKPEKEFARSLYAPDSEKPGHLVWKQELDAKEMKHLKKLGSQILKNRGFLHTGKLLILAVLLGALVVFAVFFKDQVLEDALEDALENAFQAKADIASLHFDPFGGIMRIEYLEVADKSSPMTNLFQLDKTELSLDTWQILNGRMVIRNLEAQELRFGAPRTSDGTLPKRPGQEPVQASEAPTFKAEDVDLSGFINLSKLDPAKILDQEMAKLQSLAALEEIQKELETGSSAWKADLARADTERVTIEAKVKPVQNINVQKLGSAADIQVALTSIQELKGSVETGIQSATQLVSKAQSDLKRLDALQASSRSAIDKDWEYLGNIITKPVAFGQELLGSTLTQALGPRTWEIYQVLNKIPTVLEALKSDQVPAPAPEKREGRTIYFPSRTWPRFLLEKASASVWIDAERRAALTLAQISSEPDLTNSPSLLELSYDDQVISATFRSMVDLRTTAETRMELSGSIMGYPVDAGPMFESLGISSLKAVAAANIGWTMDTKGSASLNIDGDMDNLEAQVKGSDFVSRVSANILDQTERITLNLSSVFPAGQPPEFSFRSNLDSIFATALDRIIDEELSVLRLGLEKEFRALVAKQVAENETLGNLYKEYLADSNGQLKDIKSFEGIVGNKQKDVEARAKKLLTDSVKLPGGGAVPTLPKLELPSSGFKLP